MKINPIISRIPSFSLNDKKNQSQLKSDNSLKDVSKAEILQTKSKVTLQTSQSAKQDELKSLEKLSLRL